MKYGFAKPLRILYLEIGAIEGPNYATVADLPPLLAAGPRCVLAARPLAEGFVLSLYEIVLEALELESLAEVTVLEGRRGVVLDRERLASLPLVFGLHEAVAAYLEQAAATTRDGS